MGVQRTTGTATKALVKLGKPPDDCWEWLGCKNSYGVARKTWLGKTLLARRWLYTLLFGPIADGLVLSMKCNNDGCVNPHHMSKPRTKAVAMRESDVAVLVPGDVEEIRNGNEDANVIAARLGVTPRQVRSVRARGTWAGRSKKLKTIPVPMPEEPAA